MTPRPAEADLVHYRAEFGLPALTAGQFKKVDQRGGTAYPTPDAGWAGEAALDVDAITAAAPQANTVLVVADDNSFENLGAAVNQAVAQGAEVVNNSYGTGYNSSAGSGEDDTLLPLNEQYYNHPGVAILASSGDSDYGVSFPASSNYVTAIGGTSLVKDTGTARGWTELVWHNTYGGPGSGCSIVFDKLPSLDVAGCDKRSVADVSAVADQETGLSVYYTYAGGECSQYGGTSLSSPLIAGMYALAGKPAAGTYPNSYPYLKPGAFFDVTAGSNGTCTRAVLCTAGPGYDGPTGLGTPNGVSGFAATETGTVAGTVTHDGAPLAGVTVSIGDAGSATTGADGTYTAAVPAGTYAVTFSAYGYRSVTKAGVVVAVGETATVSAALVAVPSRAVSGTVKDGSGHGYPLYSMITIDGAPGGPVHTDPFDGSYSVNLPQGQTLTLTYTPMIPGCLARAEDRQDRRCGSFPQRGRQGRPGCRERARVPPSWSAPCRASTAPPHRPGGPSRTRTHRDGRSPMSATAATSPAEPVASRSSTPTSPGSARPFPGRGRPPRGVRDLLRPPARPGATPQR